MATNVNRRDSAPHLEWPSIAAASSALRPPQRPRDGSEARAVVLAFAPLAGVRGKRRRARYGVDVDRDGA